MFDRIPPWLLTSASDWAQFKLALGHRLGLSADLLHVHGGIAVLCLAALVLRRSPLSFRPWLALLVFECGNEAGDLLLEGMGSIAATLAAARHDLINTMLAPTLLLLTGWWQRRRSKADVQP